VTNNEGVGKKAIVKPTKGDLAKPSGREDDRLSVGESAPIFIMRGGMFGFCLFLRISSSYVGVFSFPELDSKGRPIWDCSKRIRPTPLMKGEALPGGKLTAEKTVDF